MQESVERRRGAMPKPRTEEAPRMKRLFVEIPEDLHAALKSRAAEERRTVRAVVIRLLEQGLERGSKGRKD